jgi:D-sedoheptulose 7-phosphate isomerase
MAEISQASTNLVRVRLEDSLRIKQGMLHSDCVRLAVAAADVMITALRNGGKVLFFGNGGSSMDAGHLAAELAGRFYRDRPGLAGISLPDSTASMTAIANDYSYDDVFARQIRALGRPGDVAIGLTTSGNSRNVVEALKAAHEIGLFTIALTGQAGGKVVDAVDICIRVPTDDTPRVQEACLHLGHTICEIVEQEMYPDV